MYTKYIFVYIIRHTILCYSIKNADVENVYIFYKIFKHQFVVYSERPTLLFFLFARHAVA